MATISFQANTQPMDNVPGDGDGPVRQQYSMQLKSKHMKTNVTNKGYPAKPKNIEEIKAKYKVSLKKEVYLKFFMILKLQG